MNSQTMTSRADLELAEVALRDALGAEFHEDSKSDATSLGRILVHLVNMNRALSTSPEVHANVAKRLGDFAVSTSKMADRNPEAAPKLERLAEAFRSASARLRENLPPVEAAPRAEPTGPDFAEAQLQRHVSKDAAIQFRP